MSTLRIAAQWPSNITCKYCRTKHYYKYGSLIAIPYMLILFIAMFYVTAFSDSFVTFNNGIYTTSPLQLAVKFGGFILSFLVIGSIYALIIKKYLTLHIKN